MGSVAVTSPVIRNAWQRQPPKSISRRSQLRQGSGIQSVPRKRWKMGARSQMTSSEWSRTLGNSSPGISRAVWHGRTKPSGATLIDTMPQPWRQAFGKRSK